MGASQTPADLMTFVVLQVITAGLSLLLFDVVLTSATVGW